MEKVIYIVSLISQSKSSKMTLMGQFRFFEVVLYELLTDGQCLASVDGGQLSSGVEKPGPVLTGSSAVNVPRSKLILHT